MSCNDIILSFLEDIAQDGNWEESFQFPESVLNEVKTVSAADNDQQVNSNLVSVPGFPSKLSPVTVPSDLDIYRDNSLELEQGSPISNCSITSSQDGSTSKGTSSTYVESAIVTPPHISSDTTNSSLIDSPGFSDNSTVDQMSSTDSNNSGSDIEDYYFERQLCHIDWGVGEKFDWGMGGTGKNYTDGILNPTSKSVSVRNSKKAPLLRAKKRKYETSSKKKDKLSAEEMLICVVNFLRAKNSPPAEIEARKNNANDPIYVTQQFIQTLLGVSIITPDSLLKFITPTGVLESKSLSSLADRASSKIPASSAHPKSWSAFVATETVPALRFPEKHDGIMKINGAARKFCSALASLLSSDVVNHESMCYTATLNYDSSILSKPTRQVAAPFIWRSKGLVAFGYSSELEFNGLIRCSFNKAGVITLACLSFDACSLVRHCHNLSNHDTSTTRAPKKDVARVPGVTLSSIMRGLPSGR